jgi:tetratricopeptide (TPR) repeat protein
MTPDAPEDLFNQGVAAYDAKDYPTAIALYQDALKVFRDLNDTFWIARTLNALGLASHNSALKISRSTLAPDKLQERRIGLTNAIQFYQDSLAVSSDNRVRAAETLSNLGEGYRELGHYDQAIKDNKEALEIYVQELQYLDSVAEKKVSPLRSLGSIYQSLDQDTEAERYYLQLIELLEVISDTRTKGEILIELGDFYSKKGKSLRVEFPTTKNIGLKEFSTALEFFYKAWQISKISRGIKETEILKKIVESASDASDASVLFAEIQDFPPSPIPSRP